MGDLAQGQWLVCDHLIHRRHLAGHRDPRRPGACCLPRREIRIFHCVRRCGMLKKQPLVGATAQQLAVSSADETLRVLGCCFGGSQRSDHSDELMRDGVATTPQYHTSACQRPLAPRSPRREHRRGCTDGGLRRGRLSLLQEAGARHPKVLWYDQEAEVGGGEKRRRGLNARCVGYGVSTVADTLRRVP